jgi:SpoVK/Ycf46/Vps4 family AAA+-type ATPase
MMCGDIGDRAVEVEANLESSFQLAHKWGCVLLLDEADIFLQKRDKEDIKRNSIVSVFLRVLEYYRLAYVPNASLPQLILTVCMVSSS